MTLRRNNRWEEFLKLVEIEKYYQENLRDIEITFESLSPENIDNCGRVIKYESGKEVKYKLKFKQNEFSKEVLLTSKLGKCNF